jgi:hypothetical protein
VILLQTVHQDDEIMAVVFRQSHDILFQLNLAHD